MIELIENKEFIINNVFMGNITTFEKEVILNSKTNSKLIQGPIDSNKLSIILKDMIVQSIERGPLNVAFLGETAHHSLVLYEFMIEEYKSLIKTYKRGTIPKIEFVYGGCIKFYSPTNLYSALRGQVCDLLVVDGLESIVLTKYDLMSLETFMQNDKTVLATVTDPLLLPSYTTLLSHGIYEIISIPFGDDDWTPNYNKGFE